MKGNILITSSHGGVLVFALPLVLTEVVGG